MLAGADPYIRTVQVGAQRVPYWQGGPAYAPWAQGYYSGWQGSNLIRDIAIGSMIFHGLSGLPYMMGGMGEGFGEIGEGVGDMFGGIGDGFESIGDGIGDAFGGAKAFWATCSTSEPGPAPQTWVLEACSLSGWECRCSIRAASAMDPDMDG